MCKSCSASHVNRREFLAAGGAMGAAGILSTLCTEQTLAAAPQPASTSSKTPPRVVAVFLYPPADVVNAGELEDSWRGHHWFTWPGNQFEPEQQQQTFTAKIEKSLTASGFEVEFEPQAIYQEAKVEECIERPRPSRSTRCWSSTSGTRFRLGRASWPSIGSHRHRLP